MAGGSQLLPSDRQLAEIWKAVRNTVIALIIEDSGKFSKRIDGLRLAAAEVWSFIGCCSVVGKLVVGKSTLMAIKRPVTAVYLLTCSSTTLSFHCSARTHGGRLFTTLIALYSSPFPRREPPSDIVYERRCPLWDHWSFLVNLIRLSGVPSPLVLPSPGLESFCWPTPCRKMNDDFKKNSCRVEGRN